MAGGGVCTGGTVTTGLGSGLFVAGGVTVPVPVPGFGFGFVVPVPGVGVGFVPVLVPVPGFVPVDVPVPGFLSGFWSCDCFGLSGRVVDGLSTFP